MGTTDASREAAIRRLQRELELPDEIVGWIRETLARPRNGRDLVPASTAQTPLPKPSWLERAGLTDNSGRGLSAIEQLNALCAADAKREEQKSRDPWRLPLERLRGTVGTDGVERVSTNQALDYLGVPRQGRRGPGASQRLSKVMVSLGWSAQQYRGLSQGGWRVDRVRGYCREAVW